MKIYNLHEHKCIKVIITKKYFKSTMIGDEATPYRVMLEISHPMKAGVIKDWDDMILLWDYGFKKVRIFVN